jgi:hypothetical protein
MSPPPFTTEGLNHTDCEYEEFPTGRYEGEDKSYSDWLLPFSESAPPNFPEAVQDAPLPFVKVDPPTSGTLKLLDESKDQYAARPLRVEPDGAAADTELEVLTNPIARTANTPRRERTV